MNTISTDNADSTRILDHAAHEESEEFPRLRRELAPARLRTMAQELVAVQTARTEDRGLTSRPETAT